MRACKFRMPSQHFLPMVEKLTQEGFSDFSPVRLTPFANILDPMHAGESVHLYLVAGFYFYNIGTMDHSSRLDRRRRGKRNNDHCETILAPRSQNDRCSQLCKMASGTLSKTAARTGDDDDFSFNVLAHGCLLVGARRQRLAGNGYKTRIAMVLSKGSTARA
jgi:hypothetical protein